MLASLIVVLRQFPFPSVSFTSVQGLDCFSLKSKETTADIGFIVP